jgi:DNA-binding HxlR family transcriptional regulator
MFGKISKEDFKYLLSNSKREISSIFDLLDELEALDILSLLYYKKATYDKLKTDLSYFDKNILSSYVVKLLDFGIVELDHKDRYHLSKTGRKFLEITIQLVFNAFFNDEVVDEKMKKILIQHVGKEELAKFKKEMKRNKDKGRLLSLRRSK